MWILTETANELAEVCFEQVIDGGGSQLAPESHRPGNLAKLSAVPVTVSGGMAQLMHKDAEDVVLIVDNGRDQDLMRPVFRRTRRPVLTNVPIVRLGTAGWEATGDPNLVREREAVQIEQRTQLSDSGLKPIFTCLVHV